LSISRKTIELAKTILILLLTINGLFLAWRTGLFSDAIAAFPVIGNVAQLMRATPNHEEPRATIIREAARPISIVITNEQGERLGVRGDVAQRNLLYDQSISIMSEAMGSASRLSEINSEEWRIAILGPGVLFEYITPINISIIAEWFGAGISEIDEDVYIRRVLISFREDRSRLYFQNYQDDLYLGADTASMADKGHELLDFTPNGAMFAFETGIRGYEQAPYQLILQGTYHPYVRSDTIGSQQEILEAALIVFGHYFEMPPTSLSGNALVSFGTQFNMRVYPDGRVMYRRTDVPYIDAEQPEITLSEMIEQARLIVDGSIGEKSGEAEVKFEAIRHSEGVDRVYFGYYIAGGRIYLHDDRQAAIVSFSGGVIIDAELNFRSFYKTGEYMGILPEKQAFAAANGEFILSYSDIGQEILHPSWARVWF